MGWRWGRSQDIYATPYRLQSVTIYSCLVIDSLAFSYTDRDGQHHSSGHWDGHGGACNTVLLGPSEFLTGISGTIDSYEDQSQVITSLMLVTNARSYGPFGRTQGTPFQVPLQSNGCIVGFFGRADQYLNAVGVYTNHNAGVARIGPWGGDGGMSCDIDDHNDQQHHAGPWGGCGGNDHKVSLKHNEIKLLFKKK
ncbi:hypothetical protein HU200_034600 [Digitaria exilis]|uniref:Jacalin-type lectin domain-containing protein n=1 Tax=Digitaria exilis TaxID=1010633 RepID=A0A835BHQ8_9POAL|nr:hypothetical protein HU200_034600 [Digitaria exilis]